MGVLLVVDSEGKLAESVTEAFAGKSGFHAIIERGSGRAAISALQEGFGFDLAMVDDRLADMDGVELLASLRKLAPGLPVIMTSGQPTVEGYLKALNHGAFEFVARPVSASYLRRIMTAAIEDTALSRLQPAERPTEGSSAGLRSTGASAGSIPR